MIDHLLNSVVDLQRSTQTLDTGGAPVLTWATRKANLRARVQPVGGTESVRYGGESNRRQWNVYVCGCADIEENDRLLLKDWSTGTLQERVLDIQSVANLQMSGVVLELVCEETEP